MVKKTVPKKAAKPTSRIHLDLSLGAKKTLEGLCEVGCVKMSDVLRQSLRLYDLLAKEVATGNKLIIRGAEGEREFLFMDGGVFDMARWNAEKTQK